MNKDNDQILNRKNRELQYFNVEGHWFYLINNCSENLVCSNYIFVRDTNLSYTIEDTLYCSNYLIL